MPLEAQAGAHGALADGFDHPGREHHEGQQPQQRRLVWLEDP
jgi:hypothetical protein